VENTCSSGGSAFRLAYQMVATGLYDACLAIGVEKMPRGFIASTAYPMYERMMGFNVAPSVFALRTTRYMADYGATVEQFAKVTVKNRKNGCLNPYSYFQKEVTIEEVLNSRMVCYPLTLLMCCPVSDGAAAAILVPKRRISKPITVAASVLRSGLYTDKIVGGGICGTIKIENPDIVEIAAREAWEISGCGPEDMDLVETHDAFSPEELMNIELLGLCGKGEAGHLLDEGTFDIDGRVPISPSGGLMAKGHPLGATGVAQICEIVWQLRGQAGQRQIEDAKIGLAHSLGAGPNCSITILKR
jgi:acetyl-CoA acetyltransferase